MDENFFKIVLVGKWQWIVKAKFSFFFKKNLYVVEAFITLVSKPYDKYMSLSSHVSSLW